MIVFWLTLAALAVGFGGVLLFGAPYLPTRRVQANQALDLLDLKPGQVFYDLGCGDGRLLKAAAQRGARAFGYELNPILFIVAYLATLGQRSRVQVRLGNFWTADISDADAVFVFLLDKYMARFDRFMSRQSFDKPLKLVSYAFKIPGKKPVKSLGPMHLFKYGRN